MTKNKSGVDSFRQEIVNFILDSQKRHDVEDFELLICLISHLTALCIQYRMPIEDFDEIMRTCRKGFINFHDGCVK